MLGALILAAGGSKRLGSPKQLVPWGDTSLLGHVVRTARSWPVDLVAVVLGADADTIIDVVDFDDAIVVLNPEWEEGVASSLRVGLDALARDAGIDAALIALGDQPFIELDVVENLVAAFRDGDRPVVVPKYRYSRGNPVVVARRLWPRLMSLEGDAGAKKLFQAHPEWVDEVWFDALPPRDIDTPADVAELRPRA